MRKEIRNKAETTKELILKRIVNTGMYYFKECHKSTTNKKMTFRNMPYMYDIYKDPSPEIVVMSSVQTGKTEWLLIKAFAGLECGLSVFHVFATMQSKNSFVKSRINHLCDKVPEYQKLERDDKRNKYLRHIGNAAWRLANSKSSTDFDEFPADIEIVDELDSCDQENIGKAKDRLDKSKYKFKWQVGNPTVKNIGTAQEWEKSTKNEWHFRCKECNELMIADLFKIVIDEKTDNEGNHISYELFDTEWDGQRDIYIRCYHCGALQERGKGKWIAGEKKAKISGYHISKIMKYDAPISELWEELKEAEGNEYMMQLFFNKRLGLPYEGVGSKVTLGMLKQAEGEYTAVQSLAGNSWIAESAGKKTEEIHTIAGVDVGEKIDIEIDLPIKVDKKRKRMMLHVARCKDFKEIEDKIAQFNIRRLVIDAKPEVRTVQDFQERMYGKCDVVRAEIVHARQGDLKLAGFKEKEDEGTLQIDRTWLLDETLKTIKSKEFITPKGHESLLDGFWAESMCSITRIYNNEREEYIWSKSHDHFLFANAFCMIAFRQTIEPVVIGNIKQTEQEKQQHEPRKGMIRGMKPRFGLRTLKRRR